MEIINGGYTNSKGLVFANWRSGKETPNNGKWSIEVVG